MRKILSFLALLVVGFALPWQAMAWDYSKQGNPQKIVLHFNDNIGGDNTMTPPPGTGVWTYEFTSNGTSVSFTVRSYWSDNNYNEYYAGVTVPKGSYTSDQSNPQNSGTAFKIEGLTSGNKYRITLAAGSSSVNNFRLMYEDITPISLTYPEKIYIHNTTPETFGVCEPSADGVYTFKHELGHDSWIGFCTSDVDSNKDDKWGTLGTRYGQKNDSEKTVPAENLDVTKSDHMWKVNASDEKSHTYEITLDLKNNKLTVKQADDTPVVTPWNFSKQDKPSQLKVAFYNMFTGDDANKELTYDNGVWSTAPFEAPESGTFDFWIEALSGDDWQHICHDMTRTALDGTTWTTDSNIADGNSLYHQANVTKGATYVFRVTGDSENSLKWLFEETISAPATYPTLYLYQDRSNNWSDKAAGQATSTDGKYTFSVDLEKDGIFVICTDPNGITGWSFDSDTILYGTDDSSSDKPIGNVDDSSSFKVRDLSGNDGKYGWKVTKAGRYTIEVDVPGQQLKVTGYSEPVVIDPVDPSNSKTIYFDNTSSKWSSVRAYIYTSDNDRLTDWGGAPEMTSIGNNIYSYTFSGDYKYVIFYCGGTQTANNVAVIDGHVYKSDSTHKVYDPEDYKVKLYMYTNANSWSGSPKTSCEETANGTYTFTVKLNANDYFAFSSKPSITQYSGGIEMTPGGDVTIGGASDKVVTDFKSASSGAWKANATGTYKLRINRNTGKLKVLSSPAAAAAAVRLPLTSADFADGKKHFFLVGDRMGEWKLQPEWELADNGDGTYSISNRFIYNTDFAVAVVDNFEDYSNHCYRWYSSNTTLGGSTVTTSAFTSNGVNERYAGETQYNGSNKFHANWDTDYWEGPGEFMSQIKLTVTNGLPTRLDFTKGSTAQKTRNRMFTLVGEGFYNNRFNNEKYNGEAGNVRTYRSNLTGSKVGSGNAEKAWQDSWIQYNPNTRRPYIDANNEYLYHTSFTPDYLTKNPVYFNRTLSDDSEFPFTSSSIQFVDYNNLDPEDDPYWDFYKSISDKETIKNNGVRKSGGEGDTEYDYQLYTLYNGEASDAGQTPKGEWTCLVVKDMWVEGEFKFWSGWGGSARRTKGTSDDNGGKSATWNGPNGGPNSNGTSEIEGFDVKEGGKVTLYKNKRNVDKENFKTKGGDMVYFDRVVLWYNEEGEVSESFIQFIQQNAGPAIYAQNSDKDTDGADNYIKYSWYIQKPEEEAQAVVQGEKPVVGYKIHRYQRTEDGNVDLGYAEGSSSKYIDVSSQNLTIADFYRNADKRPSYTKNKLDKGQSGKGFNPGVYFYTVEVFYTDNGTQKSKHATSNEVPIYADELVTPDILAYQIIEITGVDADETKAVIPNGQHYMTYSPTAGTPIYAFDKEEVEVDVEGESEPQKVIVPTNVDVLNRAAAISYLRNNQDKTLWTSDWYVRALEYDDYLDALQSYKDNGLLLDDEIPAPTLKISQYPINFDSDEQQEEFGDPVFLSYAAPFSYNNNNNFYAAIVDRKGNLTDAYFIVDLDYKYTAFATEADGSPTSEVKECTADASAMIYPIMPKPYGAVYRYKVERRSPYTIPEEELEKAHYGKITVPVNNTSTAYNGNGILEEFNTEDLADVFVELDKDFQVRSMNLEVDFFRPNIAKDIYEWYDIHYEVGIDNDADKIDLDVKATMHDKKSALDNETFNSPYRFEIHGLHPLNAVTPTVEFIRTSYESRKLETGEDRPHGLFQGNEATFGNGINLECVSNVEVNESDLGSVKLGVIDNADGTVNWMYKGHKDFSDNDETLTSPGEGGDETAEESISPYYYLIQLTQKNAAKEVVYNHTYEHLVPHYENHNSAAENIHKDKHIAIDLNDTDPLIGTYIAKGMPKVVDNEDEIIAPDVIVTAMYIYERNVVGESDDEKYKNIQGLNDLEVVEVVYHNGTTQASDVDDAEAEGTEAQSAKAKVIRRQNSTDTRTEMQNMDVDSMEFVQRFMAGDYGQMPHSTEGASTSTADPAGSYVINLNDESEKTDYNSFVAMRGYTAKASGDNLEVTGVEEVMADAAYDGEAVYYNLQGIRIEKPATPGVYIKVVGNKTTKVVIE